MKIAAAGRSDPGCVRLSNEDSIGLFPELDLYIVADGMGGHAHGEIASRMAVEEIRRFFLSSAVREQNEKSLIQAIQQANDKIYEAGSSRQTPLQPAMGTTVVAVLVRPTETFIGYVGDSRAYLYRKKKLRQATEDHSWVHEAIRQGLLTKEAALHHPFKHLLTRALGTARPVAVDTVSMAPLSEDTLLLCTDGLSNALTPAEITDSLSTPEETLQRTADRLIERANTKDGRDNVSVVLLRYEE